MTERLWTSSGRTRSERLELQQSARATPALLDGGPSDTDDAVLDAAVTTAVDPTRRPPEILAEALGHSTSYIDWGRC
jgi:hypothetical protein